MDREGKGTTQMASKRNVALALSRPAFEALVGKDGSAGEEAERRLEGAIRFYLNDKSPRRAAWPYPSFLRGSESAADVPLKVELDADLAEVFTTEAKEQSVSVSQLAEHAAFYFAAELDAGRATQRILDDPEDPAATAPKS